MTAKEFKSIRESLGMSREEIAEALCLSGYSTVMNIETGFRRPNKLAVRLLRYLDSLPKNKAHALIQELQRHEAD